VFDKGAEINNLRDWEVIVDFSTIQPPKPLSQAQTRSQEAHNQSTGPLDALRSFAGPSDNDLSSVNKTRPQHQLEIGSSTWRVSKPAANTNIRRSLCPRKNGSIGTVKAKQR
jgi:hypothetical protein